MRAVLVCLGLLLASTGPAGAWGFVAHRIVAENAVTAMPEGMSSFWRAAVSVISDASIEPDSILKDRDGEAEKRRHYFDLDELSRPPFADLVRDKSEARRRYGARRLEEAGTLPWRIQDMQVEMREAMKEGDWRKVISRAGWLSHYVADAYQPLHTTKNHDGQRTCNEGVHAAFETDMIDLGKTLYRAQTAAPAGFSPQAITDPMTFIWDELIGNYALVSDILQADSEAVRAVKGQRKNYFEEMERRAGPLARRQLSRAVTTVASLWYTAWVQAGSPELPPNPLPRRSKAKRP
ncbi:MAG TPA: hypothetical protein VFG76_11375, partial [Candidatus Polarisedimenticolia bacterium]|nr:hypothetical protein [Candidatus Polarisedimenticolia bacterium]